MLCSIKTQIYDLYDPKIIFIVKFISKKTAFWNLDDFLSIARCSKYDFLILGQILGRRSKTYFENIYFSEMKCFFEEVEKIFFETKKNREKSYEKVNGK